VLLYLPSYLLLTSHADENAQAASPKSLEGKPKVYLLEFDERFGVFPEFVFYDFKNPFKLPRKTFLSFSIKSYLYSLLTLNQQRNSKAQ